MAERLRLTPAPISGRVIEWKGSFGWIEPQCTIEHPDISKHHGRIFVHAEDAVPKWKSLTVGSLVEFYLYYDGQGLGAEECVARKVLRLTLPRTKAGGAFGNEGEGIPEFEKRIHVTMRAYQWVLVDGNQSDLPFMLFEVWGRPQAIVDAVLELTSNEVATHCSAEMLVPETRLWKVHLGQLRQRCRGTELSDAATIISPMPCRTLSIKGTKEECRASMRQLIVQVCD